jgi:hypothetical protein
MIEREETTCLKEQEVKHSLISGEFILVSYNNNLKVKSYNIHMKSDSRASDFLANEVEFKFQIAPRRIATQFEKKEI